MIETRYGLLKMYENTLENISSKIIVHYYALLQHEESRKKLAVLLGKKELLFMLERSFESHE